MNDILKDDYMSLCVRVLAYVVRLKDCNQGPPC